MFRKRLRILRASAQKNKKKLKKFKKPTKDVASQLWWFIAVILTLRRLGKGYGSKLDVCLVCSMTLCLKGKEREGGGKEGRKIDSYIHQK